MMYQRRRLDLPSAVDFTRNSVGERVVVEVADVITCPGCGLPCIVEQTAHGNCYTHRRSATGLVTEACVERPDGEAELVIWDKDGELAFVGDFPQEKDTN
jgi:hypothetical protein